MDERILRVGVQTEQAERNLDSLEKKFVSTGKSAQTLEDATKRNAQQSQRLGQQHQELGSKTTRLKTTFSELAQGLRQAVGLMAGLGGSVSFALAIRSALQLDAAMDKVRAITGATTDEMKAFTTEVRKLSETVGRPQTELAESLFLIKQAGYDGADAMRILTASSKAAAIGLGETKVIADAVTSVLNLYGRNTITAERATAILVLTAREGKVSMDQFEAGLGKVLPVAKSLGISFDQVSAALATMSRSGVDTKQAAASLASIMDTLAAPSTDAAKALTEAHITVDKLRESLANKGIIAVLGDLKKAFEGNEEGLNRLFPNLRGMTGVLTLVGDKAAEAARIQKLLADETGGALTKAFEEVTDESLKYDIALQKINNQMIELGTENLPIVSGALSVVNTIMDRLRLTAKNSGEALANAFTGSAIELQSLSDYIVKVDKDLSALESRRRAILRNNTSSQDRQELDKDARKSGFETFDDLNKAIAQGRANLKRTREEEARQTEAALVDLAERLGSKTVEAYQASIIRAIGTHKLTFGLSAMFTGLTQAQIEQMESDANLITRFEDELEKKRIARNKQRGLAIAENAPRVGRAGGGLGSPVTEGEFIPVAPGGGGNSNKLLGEEEKARLAQLTEQYDEFSSKVKALSKDYAALSAGVKSGAISSESATRAYSNMVIDITKTASAAGTFNQAMDQSAVAIKILDDAIKNHGTSADEVQLAYKGMFAGLTQLAGEADTFAERLANSEDVVRMLARAVGDNGIAAEAAKGNVKTLVEQLAGASVASGVFAESVQNSNQVLLLMGSLVKAGALDVEVARRIYAELGKTLVELHPDLEKNKSVQEAWNTLLSNGLSPLDIYNEKLEQLSKAYQKIVTDGGDAEEAQRLFSNSALAAAKEYNAAISELTPKQEQQKDAIERVAQASSNAFSNMIQGANDFKDALNGLLRSILDVIAQLAILEPLKQALVGGLTSFFGVPATGGAEFAPPTNAPIKRASGGIVKQGRHYEVGEEGPELLLGNFESARAVLVGQAGPEQIVAPKGGGRIISNRETRMILDGMPEERKKELLDERLKRSIEPTIEKRAAGGAISGGVPYQVGEEGAELLVMGRSQPMRQRENFQPIVVKIEQKSQEAQSKTVVNIQNYTGQEVDQQSRRQSDGSEIIDIVIGTVTRNIDERGSVSKAISRSNRLMRR